MRDVTEETRLLPEGVGQLPTDSTVSTTRPSVDSQSPHNEEDSTAEQPVQTVTVWRVVPFLLLGVLIACADMTLFIASSQKIASEFDALSDASWLITSYVLAECASQPLYGKLIDIFGRKAPLILAYILFAAGCLLCGIASGFSMVLVGRAISGTGSSGMIALVSIIVADMVPARQVAAWRSYINIAQTLGRSLGGPVGGLLADSIGWRWIFFGQCPLAIIAILLVLWKLPSKSRKAEDSKDNQSLRKKLKRIDVLGAMLLALVISSLLISMELIGREVSWQFVLIPVALSIISGAIFYRVETKWAKEPVLPMEILTKRATLTSYLLVGLQNSAQCSMLFLVPVYFQIAAETNVAATGIRLVPAVIGNTIGGLLSGFFIAKTGRYKLLTICASAIATLGYTLILIRWQGHTLWPELSYIFLGGFGMGVIASTTFVHLVASLDNSEMAIAGTNSFLAQNMSFTIGLQLATTILHTAVRAGLQKELRGFKNRAEIIEEAISSIQSIRSLPSATRDIVVHVYVNSLRYSYMSSVVAGGLGLLIGVTIQEGKM